MTKQLLILRHAKSDWHSDVASDFDRPLNKRGKKQAPLIGQWMQQHEINPDIIVSSPAVRARQTIQRVCGAACIDSGIIQWDDDLYLAGLHTLIGKIARRLSRYEQIMVVGHNPGLEILLCHLCGDDLPSSDNGKLLPTATLAVVELSDKNTDLAAHSGSLTDIIRPGELENEY